MNPYEHDSEKNEQYNEEKIWNAMSEEEITARWEQEKETAQKQPAWVPALQDDTENQKQPPKKKKSQRKQKIALCCVLLTTLMIGVVSTTVAFSYQYHQKIASLEQKVQSLQGSGLNLQNVGLFSSDSTSLRNIVAQVSPSVVGIKVSVPPTQSVRGGFVWQSDGEEVSGSGFIMNYDGYIATNYHVVETCASRSDALIEVSLADGRTAEGTYIAGDEQNDLAVIHIDLKDLTPVTLGNSDELMPGDTAIAIGNPLGSKFAGSVTAGIISGIDRQISSENMPDSLLQTDAAINPGNSGGPLLNANGEVIGINTVKIASTGVEGLGFAIPINEAYPILQSLMEYGYVKDRPATGISGAEISDLASAFYQLPAGLLVQEVASGSSAEKAGIHQGDILLTLDGQSVSSHYEINQILKQHKVGDRVEAEIWRSGQTLTVEMTLQEDK